MPHPEPRMSPQLAVGARAAPVLNQEHPQPLLRPGQVRLRVERSQFGIGSHPGVESGDQKPKRLRAADGVIEADSRLFAHGPRSRPVPAARKANVSTESSIVRDTDRAPCPTLTSRRSNTGRSLAVACCNAAHILRACNGSTRVSASNTVNSTAG